MDNSKVTELRNNITKIIMDVKNETPNRITSLVITKLEEAQMWAGNLFSKDKNDVIIKRDY